MKKLKIAILDIDDLKNPLLGGGQARITFEIGRRLVKKGHKVVVYCSKYPGFEDRISEGIEYRHVSYGTKNIKLNNLLYIFSVPFFVPKIRADVIIECFTPPFSVMFSPLFTKLPVVAVPSSFEADRFSKIYKLPFWVVERFGVLFYKYFMPYVISSETRMKKMNSKIISEVIPLGIDEGFFKIKNKKPKHILFLGRLDINQKGIDLLLGALQKVATNVKYPLVLAGSGPDEEKIKKLLKKYNLDKRVKMVGAVDGKMKEKLLSEAVCFVFPSRSETFGMSALEALASGKVLISFDIPGLKWIDSDVVLKAKPFKVDEYAKLLQKATDSVRLSKIGSLAKKFAKDFTWDKTVQKQESFLQKIIAKERIKK